MKNYRVGKSQLKGRCSIPTSKSQSIRSILFASMASGSSVIESYLKSPDIMAMIAACRQLGAVIEQEEERLLITGVAGRPCIPDDVIDAGNSGQVLRFIAPLAGLLSHYVVITGDASIRHNRPVKPLLEALPALGISCESMRGDDHAPLIIKGPYTGLTTCLSGEDSQPVSGLIMAAVFMQGLVKIHVRDPGEKPWIDLTLCWLDRFKVPYQNYDYCAYEISGGASIAGFNYRVPGDLSSLSFPLVAAIVTGSGITIDNVDMDELQGDKAIVDVLQKMGAKISLDGEEKSLTVHPGATLQGISVDIDDFVDCIAILAVVGCYAQSQTHITGAAIARKKECDRITAITQELTKMGAKIEELADGMIIYPSKLKAAQVEGHHDHRIAMALAVAAMGVEGDTTIMDVAWVDKSFPDFDRLMQSLGANLKTIDANNV